MPLQDPAALPHQPDPAHLAFLSPIALHSYHPNPTHDSSAPRRGVEGGAGQLFSVGGQGRGVGVVTAEPSWVAKRPRRCDPARSGRPAGGRRSRGCPDAGHAGRRPVRVLSPPCGRPSNRSSGRPVSMRPVSMRPVPSRCPGGRASGVRGSATALSAPRWILEWLGAAGRPR
jgi:hypothetical protein